MASFAGPALPLPPEDWKGQRLAVAGEEKETLCAVGHPAAVADKLVYQGKSPLPPGLYRLRLTVRPSHISGPIAWAGSLTVTADTATNTFDGFTFGRVHQPEEKILDFIHSAPDPVRITLAAPVEVTVFEDAAVSRMMKSGGPKLDATEEGKMDLDELAFTLNPDKAFYYLFDGAELERLSASACVTDVGVEKIRYAPGATLKGNAIVRNLGGDKARGRLTFYLEHDLNVRDKVKELPVELGKGESRRFDIEVPLPRRELGHALVAVFQSDNGQDVSEKADYFSIADNFYRVAIFAAHLLYHGGAVRGESTIRPVVEEARRNYGNCMEFFSWAEDDLTEMSPDTDYWFSGQSCYQQSKDGVRTTVRLAHEQGIAMVTYGKFSSIGYAGWKTGYDYPDDYKSQYDYAPGMWSPVNVRYLDRMRFKEFVPLTTGPAIREETAFQVAWQTWPALQHFVPDLTPRMVRLSAEEVLRSVDMFGWDGIRWDGHPCSGWAHGGKDVDQYAYEDARKTEMLMRYFKAIVNDRHPAFRHGYNYLNNMAQPAHDWACEDFELDELCRDGGLLMNESMKEAAGQTYEWVAQNLQVQGDLSRERGGFLLSFEVTSTSPRDQLASRILLLAAGARPCNVREVHGSLRYATRFSRYGFDETLRRLARPGGVIKPAAATTLWWDPFVYETRPEKGHEQLVVNLINLPRAAVFKGERSPKRDIELDLPAAAAAVAFDVTLPPTHKLTAAHAIDPFTLAVTSLPMKDGRVAAPSVRFWSVLVLDVEVQAGAPALADTWGPPPTLGVPRKGLTAKRVEAIPLGARESEIEVNRLMARLFPAKPGVYDEKPDLNGLTWDARNQRLLDAKKTSDSRADILITNAWWKGGAMTQDQDAKNKPMDFGDLTPVRDGVTDIYYARNMMDHSLRLYDSFARLPRFRVDEGLLAGQCREAATGQYLEGGIPWSRFPVYDVLVYSDIPHCAIGVTNSYALVSYVKAGGGAFFTGGMYAFGRGAYEDTILDRELLPVVMPGLRDTRIVRDPLTTESGRDFGSLGVTADFGAKPAFWCWNEVALREGADVKVFLKAGNRPILVGWQLGKGRVACLLTTHRGKSENGVTAFFDWADWPRVQEAVIRWLTPEAVRKDPPTAAKADAALRKEMEKVSMDDAVLGNEDLATHPEASLGSDDAAAAHEGRVLKADALREREALIRGLLKSEGADVSAFLAEQLVSVANLPDELWGDMLNVVRRSPPPNLAEIAKPAINSSSPDSRGRAAVLLALAGDPEFATWVRSSEATETSLVTRERYLALAVALYGRDDLKSLGRQRLKDWADEEAAVKAAYTGGKDFSLAAPEQPCLGQEILFQRLGWLAYMARWEPEAHASGLGREWLMTAQYQDFCDRTSAQLWRAMEKASPSEQARFMARVYDVQRLGRLFGRMADNVEPRIEAVFKSHPEQTTSGFAQVGFLLAAKKGIRFVGPFPATEIRRPLEILRTARQPALAEFAAARLPPPTDSGGAGRRNKGAGGGEGLPN